MEGRFRPRPIHESLPLEWEISYDLKMFELCSQGLAFKEPIGACNYYGNGRVYRTMHNVQGQA
jgi:hypothetical protein